MCLEHKKIADQFFGLFIAVELLTGGQEGLVFFTILNDAGQFMGLIINFHVLHLIILNLKGLGYLRFWMPMPPLARPGKPS